MKNLLDRKKPSEYKGAEAGLERAVHGAFRGSPTLSQLVLLCSREEFLSCPLLMTMMTLMPCLTTI